MAQKKKGSEKKTPVKRVKTFNAERSKASGKKQKRVAKKKAPTLAKTSRKRSAKVSGQKKPERPPASVQPVEKMHVRSPGETVLIGETQPRETQTRWQDLPQRYGEDKIVLHMRDPWWLYTYWELQTETVEYIQREFTGLFEGARRILRVYNITGVSHFDGDNANEYYDIDIGDEALNWYIEVPDAGNSWCIDLGFILNDGTFLCVVRSNIVHMPSAAPSPVLDEEWMIPDELFQRLFGREGYQQSMTSLGGRQFASQVFPWALSSFPISSFVNVSSWGVSSFSLPGSFSMPGSFNVGSWSMGSWGVSSLSQLKPFKGSMARVTNLSRAQAKRPHKNKTRSVIMPEKKRPPLRMNVSKLDKSQRIRSRGKRTVKIK